MIMMMTQVKPGYLRELLPEAAPQEGEEFNKIFGDIERVRQARA